MSFALQICILALPYNSLCTSFTDQQSMYSLYHTTIYVIALRFNNLCTRFTYNSLCTRYTVQQSMYSLYHTTINLCTLFTVQQSLYSLYRTTFYVLILPPKIWKYILSRCKCCQAEMLFVYELVLMHCRTVHKMSFPDYRVSSFNPILSTRETFLFLRD